MDKSRKTPWERKMRRWKITLLILIPLTFGIGLWVVAHHNPYGK